MIVGVVKETKDRENRVALTPAGVEALVRRGHTVLAERAAGLGSGFSDEAYAATGAQIEGEAAEVWRRADLVVKVKEPLRTEYPFLRPDLILFTYLHLAAEPELTAALVDRGVTAIGYETVQLADGRLPLLEPMSEVAGRLAVQVGAHYLERTQGGSGKLLGGVPGVPPGEVMILGAGTSGSSAVRVALGMGAEVTVLDVDVERLRLLEDTEHGRLRTIASSHAAIAELIPTTDLLIGCVLVAGAKAPVLVEADLVGRMRPGSVIVDVAIDQGGCVETSRPTSHSSPTRIVDGVIYYAVPNMPGAVPQTSTAALTNATLPYVLRLADRGLAAALAECPELARAVNTRAGAIAHPALADLFGTAGAGTGSVPR